MFNDDSDIKKIPTKSNTNGWAAKDAYDDAMQRSTDAIENDPDFHTDLDRLSRVESIKTIANRSYPNRKDIYVDHKRGHISVKIYDPMGNKNKNVMQQKIDKGVKDSITDLGGSITITSSGIRIKVI